MMDTDRDQKVYEEEILAFHTAAAALRRQRAELKVTPSSGDLYEVLDANKDQRISLHEAKVAADRLLELDANGDKRIGFTEIPGQIGMNIVLHTMCAVALVHGGSCIITNYPG